MILRIRDNYPAGDDGSIYAWRTVHGSESNGNSSKCLFLAEFFPGECLHNRVIYFSCNLSPVFLGVCQCPFLHDDLDSRNRMWLGLDRRPPASCRNRGITNTFCMEDLASLAYDLLMRFSLEWRKHSRGESGKGTETRPAGSSEWSEEAIDFVDVTELVDGHAPRAGWVPDTMCCETATGRSR